MDGIVRRYTRRIDDPKDTHPRSEHGVPNIRRARPIRLVGLLVSVGSLLAACSSSPAPSASQKVCDDRTQLNNAVSTVSDDLHSGNFAKAKDDLPAVRDAVNSLKKSAKELASQESQALKPQIDNLKKTAANLKNATSLSDLQTGFSSLKAQIQSIDPQIGQTLKCS
jgi:chromosome segregation ATPase